VTEASSRVKECGAMEVVYGAVRVRRCRLRCEGGGVWCGASEVVYGVVTENVKVTSSGGK
jgi:hypothetical protein